jgi:CRISPR-associated endonuclease Cas2
MSKSYLICYDVFDTKRLKKVKKVAYSYAFGGQKSALEAPLDSVLMMELIKELEKILKDEDKVNIIRVSKPILLGKATRIEYIDNGVVIV